nr:hypothetical protein [uncultured Dyadobacter sp.]
MDRIVNKSGIMKKRPSVMTANELMEWKREAFERAKAYLFSIGQPLVYFQKDGTAVAEYADGRIEAVE